jgi:hypothetical protein
MPACPAGTPSAPAGQGPLRPWPGHEGARGRLVRGHCRLPGYACPAGRFALRSAVPSCAPPGSGLRTGGLCTDRPPERSRACPGGVPAQHCLIQCGGAGCCGLEPVEVVEVTPLALDDLRGCLLLHDLDRPWHGDGLRSGKRSRMMGEPEEMRLLEVAHHRSSSPERRQLRKVNVSPMPQPSGLRPCRNCVPAESGTCQLVLPVRSVSAHNNQAALDRGAPVRSAHVTRPDGGRVRDPDRLGPTERAASARVAARRSASAVLFAA